MSEDDWEHDWLRCFGMRLGEQLGEVDELGELLTDDTLLVLLNAHHEPVSFVLPDRPGPEWEVLFDTSCVDARPRTANGTFELDGRSVVLMRGV
jgi:glycogen operon protein